MMRITALHWLALAACLLLPAGCSQSSGTGVVKGKITVNGQIIPRGLITFMSEVGNKDVFNSAIIDGMYETSAIPCGPTKVVIIPTSQKPQEGGSDLLKVAPRAKSGLDVPAKFQTAETTPLSFKVEKGSNTFDQDLTP